VGGIPKRGEKRGWEATVRFKDLSSCRFFVYEVIIQEKATQAIRPQKEEIWETCPRARKNRSQSAEEPINPLRVTATGIEGEKDKKGAEVACAWGHDAGSRKYLKISACQGEVRRTHSVLLRGANPKLMSLHLVSQGIVAKARTRESPCSRRTNDFGKTS